MKTSILAMKEEKTNLIGAVDGHEFVPALADNLLEELLFSLRPNGECGEVD